jgi:hypothetical protein
MFALLVYMSDKQASLKRMRDTLCNRDIPDPSKCPPTLVLPTADINRLMETYEEMNEEQLREKIRYHVEQEAELGYKLLQMEYKYREERNYRIAISSRLSRVLCEAEELKRKLLPPKDLNTM